MNDLTFSSEVLYGLRLYYVKTVAKAFYSPGIKEETRLIIEESRCRINYYGAFESTIDTVDDLSALFRFKLLLPEHVL